MKTKILLVLLLGAQSYPIHGSGKDIIVNANNSDDA